MNNERITRALFDAEIYLKNENFYNFRRFSENILRDVEHIVNDLHDDGTLDPSEEIINLLHSLCTHVYDLSVHFIRNGQTEIADSLDPILFHLIKIRKFCLFSRLEVPMLLKIICK